MQLRPFLLLTLPHQPAEGCTRSWEGTLLGQLNVPKDIPYPITLSILNWGKKEEDQDVQGDAICLSKSLIEPCCPGNVGTLACPWETVNGFSVLHCFCGDFCFLW